MFYVRKLRSESLSIHSSAGDQDNTCAKDEDCTDNIEDCGTDTTGRRKLLTLFVDDRTEVEYCNIFICIRHGYFSFFLSNIAVRIEIASKRSAQ